MNITLVRNATLILETPAGRLLVDPMLDPAGARPPIEDTANPVRNPTVELPFPAEQVVAGLDAVLVTHRHEDHLDDTAVRLPPRDPLRTLGEQQEACAGGWRASRPSGSRPSSSD